MFQGGGAAKREAEKAPEVPLSPIARYCQGLLKRDRGHRHLNTFFFGRPLPPATLLMAGLEISTPDVISTCQPGESE